MTCPRCQENPPQAKFRLECGAPVRGAPPKSYAEIKAENEGLGSSLSEALEQQTATAEILRVISSSPTDLQPVFDAIVRSASHLCGGEYAIVTRYDGELLHLAAQYNPRPGTAEETARSYPRVVRRDVHVVDIDTEALPPEVREVYGRIGLRAAVCVPTLYEGRPVGVVAVSRGRPGAFTSRQIDLLQTFAAQAVIAIENVRLFNETKEALDDSAMRLFGAWSVGVSRYDGELSSLVAARGGLPGSSQSLMATWQAPHLPSHDSPMERAVLSKTVQHVVDAETDPSWGLEARQITRDRGFRSAVSVPMLRGSDAIGSITVSRVQVGGFSATEIQLLQTFADQAVIAIENVRLFKELEIRNRDLTESLEQQTATAEILRVISSSPTDLRPVFATIVRNAVKLCGAAFGGLHRIAGGRITLDAQYGVPADELAILRRDVFPLPMSRESATGRAMLDRAVVHIRDIREDPDISAPRVRTMPNYRTILAVPLLREGLPIGALALWRREVQPFRETEVSLVQTFAVECNQVHTGRWPDRSRGRAKERVRGGVSQRHRGRHRAGGPRGGVRGVPPGGDGGQEGRGYRARADPLPEVHRTPRRADRGQEPGGRRLDVHVHDSGAREERGQR
jgi:two-component system, NtrC family, sensor kinase